MRKKILLIVSEDWYFISHRMHLASEAISRGYDVALLSNYNTHKKEIEQAGILTIKWGLNRKSNNLFTEFITLINLAKAIRIFKPSFIHAVALKPVIYSSVISLFLGLEKRIFAFAGLGYLFTSTKNRIAVLRRLLLLLFRISFKGKCSRLIIQNQDDKNELMASKIINKNNIRIIRGAGVDSSRFYHSQIPFDSNIVVLPARMLWDKGVGEFVKVAKIVNDKFPKAKFVLVGSPDKHNPQSIKEKQLQEWVSENYVEWWGHQKDMENIYKQAKVICLPSYREGLPKSLLEAASCGRPIVTYDVPGCREIVKDGYNGYLIEPKNVDGLVDAISKLLNNRKLCIKMGKNGRKLVEKYFTQERIAKETIAVWEEVLAS